MVEYIHRVVWRIIIALFWLNVDLLAKLRMDTRVSVYGIATLLLQYHPDKSLTWMPMTNWCCCLEPLEKLESHILLKLKVQYMFIDIQQNNPTWIVGGASAVP